MSPTQIFRDGTPGSDGILQTTLQMPLNRLAFGMTMHEAIQAPHRRVTSGTMVKMEDHVPDMSLVASPAPR